MATAAVEAEHEERWWAFVCEDLREGFLAEFGELVTECFDCENENGDGDE